MGIDTQTYGDEGGDSVTGSSSFSASVSESCVALYLYQELPFSGCRCYFKVNKIKRVAETYCLEVVLDSHEK